MVRKRGTGMWMNPGGKPEPGESPERCGAREVAEELGLTLDPAELVPLGEYAAPPRTSPATPSCRSASGGPRRSGRTCARRPRSRPSGGSAPSSWATPRSRRSSWTRSCLSWVGCG
nr:NUDIX domain-containing protein [Tessaracoccus coleopterorum]